MTRKTNTHIVLGATAEGSLHSLHFEAGAMPQLSQWCARIHIEMPFLYFGDILWHPHRSYYRLGHFVFQSDYSLLYTGTPAILPYCYRKKRIFRWCLSIEKRYLFAQWTFEVILFFLSWHTWPSSRTYLTETPGAANSLFLALHSTLKAFSFLMVIQFDPFHLDYKFLFVLQRHNTIILHEIQQQNYDLF